MRRLLQADSRVSSPSLPVPTVLENRRLYISRGPHPTVGLPRYIRPLPANIAADDIEWLDRRGTLILPETRLLNELLAIMCNTCTHTLQSWILMTFCSQLREMTELGKSVCYCFKPCCSPQLRLSTFALFASLAMKVGRRREKYSSREPR